MGKYAVPCPFCPTPLDCRKLETCPKELENDRKTEEARAAQREGPQR